MADSNITVSGLQATGGANQILLSWNPPNDPNRGGLPYLQFAAIEVHYSATNDRAAATLLGESVSTAFVHLNVERAAAFYYWIRPRDQSGLYGDWHPASTTGVLGRETNVNASLQATGFFRYPDGRVEEWGVNQSTNALVDGTAYDGVVSRNFQTTFSQVFGIHAMVITRFDYGPPTGILVLPFDSQVASVHLYSLTNQGFILRTTVAQPSAMPAAINGALVYWRAFGI